MLLFRCGVQVPNSTKIGCISCEEGSYKDSTNTALPAPAPGFDYSPIDRTICSWDAANYACA